MDHLTENHHMDQSGDSPLPRGNRHSRTAREEEPSPRLAHHCRVALVLNTREAQMLKYFKHLSPGLTGSLTAFTRILPTVGYTN